jgi:AraC-like DNA-binding protein
MLGDLADFFPLHTQGTIVGLSKETTGTLLTYELAADTAGHQRQVIELGFGVMIREIRRHAPDWSPEAIYLRHSPPPGRTSHRRLLGECVFFNADRNAMLLDPALLAMTTLEGDRAVHDPLAMRFGDAARLAPGLDALRTESLVRAMLPFAPIDLAIAARLLHRSRRTLQRQLTEVGTSYSAILDQVRAGLARSYLLESDLSVAEIAEILQYSETSALTRAMRRWFDQSPRAIRLTRPDR